jgi:phosphoglycerate dehydrogenase-like enzyme
MMKLLCAIDLPKWIKSKILDSLKNEAAIFFSDNFRLNELSEDLSIFEALLCDKVPINALKLMPNLKLIHFWGAGIDDIDLEELKKRGIKVCNTSGTMAAAISEYVILHILAWERNLIESHKLAKTGDWTWNKRNKMIFTELSGKTLGIVGFGCIGVRVAEKAKAFGLKIYAIKKNPDNLSEENKSLVDFLGKPSKLDFLLSKSDYVVLCLPENKNTYHLIDKYKLSQMKRKAILINISRGSIVNETDLIQYLRDGRIRGVSLDVLRQEPLPKKNPFCEIDNVILSCHHAGYTRQAIERKIELVTYNIMSLYKNQRLKNVIV